MGQIHDTHTFRAERFVPVSQSAGSKAERAQQKGWLRVAAQLTVARRQSKGGRSERRECTLPDHRHRSDLPPRSRPSHLTPISAVDTSVDQFTVDCSDPHDSVTF